ncbi:hypothetical protein FKP32DRAFT_1590805 [Trametes sanguinea]|nr:hypothetical protein FKP32DRAFT_1590805 [Trametes sanguinea]
MTALPDREHRRFPGTAGPSAQDDAPARPGRHPAGRHPGAARGGPVETPSPLSPRDCAGATR